MISNASQNEILKYINELKEKIQEIYYMGKFEDAEKLDKKLEDIKLELLIQSDSQIDITQLSDIDNIIKQLSSLKNEIFSFLETKEDKSRRRKEFFDNIDNIVSDLEKKDTNKTFEDLSLLIKKWHTYEHGEAEKQEFNQKVASAVFQILKMQAQKEEEIDLDNIQNYCSKEDLKKVIKETLIQMAKESKNPKDTQDILFMSKTLNEENLKSLELWHKLTNIYDIKIKNNETELVANNNTVNQNKFLDVMFGSSIYTLGTINPDTGKWENVKHIRGTFPKKFSVGKAKQVLAIEVNDVKEIDAHDFDQYENLQEVILGNKVTSMSANSFGHTRNIQKIKLKDIEKIPIHTFSYLKTLKEVEFGNNLREIDSRMFSKYINKRSKSST